MLTKSEFKWLLNKNSNILKSYEYKRKSDIRKKVRIFANLELPMLQKSGLFSDSLTVFGNNLTIWSKTDIPINSSNIEKCAQNMVGGKGLATQWQWAWMNTPHWWLILLWFFEINHYQGSLPVAFTTIIRFY